MSDRDLARRCIDLTTLKGDDGAARIEQLCARARAAGVAAVCVYPVFVPLAKTLLAGSAVKVATVAAGFPHGLSPLSIRIAEVAAAAGDGADEIDIVIRRSHALEGNWTALSAEVAAFREAAGGAALKAILATGELEVDSVIAGAARSSLEAGADFLKTSTGFEAVNATLPAGQVLVRELARWHRETGERRGLKAAGGIATAAAAEAWIALVRTALGEPWLTPTLFRIGASKLLDALPTEPGNAPGRARDQA